MKIQPANSLDKVIQIKPLESKNHQLQVDRLVTAAVYFAGTWVALAMINDLATTTADRYDRFCQDPHERGLCSILWINKEMWAPAYHLMKDLGSFGLTCRIAALVGVSKILDQAVFQRYRNQE